MSLRDEIQKYADKNGYVNPGPINILAGRQCDNSTMFSSEYYILLNKNGECTEYDINEWATLVSWASVQSGLTTKYPGSTEVDAPDNLYGILAASKVLNRPDIALNMLNYGKMNWGFYNPSNPRHIRNKDGNIDWSAFQWRQPQLLFAMICAANTYKWWKFWNYALAYYTALVILISCMGVDIQNTDSRRLSWLLIQAVKNDSWLCRLASKVWFKRLYRDYGAAGMKAVAAIYYSPKGLLTNPFSKYWVD